MTARLYYDDPYTTTFRARIVERTAYAGSPAVVLDQTYFYPTSGGQPNDLGTLAGVPVIDVALREDDGAVLHVVQQALPDEVDTVEGVIDWARRFDHMQHHTGQHILSQAFVEVAQADTVGFHLSPDSVTIDLNRAPLAAKLVDAAEDLANRIVTANGPVRAWFPEEGEIAALPLRKRPDVEGRFRAVEIADFDVNACGGTHVARTGEVGVIKVLRADRRGDTTRIEFRCGHRALLDYRAKNALVHQLAAEMTASYEDLPALFAKLRDENKALTRETSALRETLLTYEAGALWERHAQRDGATLVAEVFDGRDPADVRQLAQQLITRPATVALLGVSGEKAHLIAARSDDLPQDMVPVLQAGLAVWNVTRGGGRPSFAQGGGTGVSAEQVQAALSAMINALDSDHD